MSALVKVLYPSPELRRTPLRLLLWWESRRLTYNRVVGSAGLFTVGALYLLHPDRADFFAPELVFAVLAYALLANVCYTFGSMLELAAWALWREQAPRMGPILFREGLVFSVGLTLLPVLVFIFLRIAGVVAAIVT